MPRTNKPWFRSQTGTWCVNFGGRRVTLGRDKRRARAKFREMVKANAEGVPVLRAEATLEVMLNRYLVWRKERVTEVSQKNCSQFLARFLERFGRRRSASTLTVEEVEDWLEERGRVAWRGGSKSRRVWKPWGRTTRSVALTHIKAAFRWAARPRVGLIWRNPLEELKVPAMGARETALSQGQYEEVIAKFEGGFRDLLVFLWETGCRPSEAYRLKTTDVDLERHIAVLSGKTSDRTGELRKVYLSVRALEVCKARCDAHPRESVLVFVNRYGEQWSSDTVNLRIKRSGLPFTAGWFRRGFATDGALKLPPLVLGHLMGHRDGRVLAKHYAKLANRPSEVHSALASFRSGTVPPAACGPGGEEPKA